MGSLSSLESSPELDLLHRVQGLLSISAWVSYLLPSLPCSSCHVPSFSSLTQKPENTMWLLSFSLLPNHHHTLSALSPKYLPTVKKYISLNYCKASDFVLLYLPSIPQAAYLSKTYILKRLHLSPVSLDEVCVCPQPTSGNLISLHFHPFPLGWVES